MEFQEGMALCPHRSKFASKSWKFVWKGRVITRRQFPSEKKTKQIRASPKFLVELNTENFANVESVPTV